jgi:two-component system response regulator YesN
MYSNKLICEILIYISENIKNKITIEDLENKFFYNRYYIMKLFKKEIGLTIVEYINSIRIYNSITLIRGENSNLMSIAFKSGFYSLEYFSETFKLITKLNPRKFKDFFLNKKNISDLEIDLINTSIVNLYEISKIKDNYLSRQKPTVAPVKKLSIFK